MWAAAGHAQRPYDWVFDPPGRRERRVGFSGSRLILADQARCSAVRTGADRQGSRWSLGQVPAVTGESPLSPTEFSDADFGIGRSFRRAVQTSWDAFFRGTTRPGSFGS